MSREPRSGPSAFERPPRRLVKLVPSTVAFPATDEARFETTFAPDKIDCADWVVTSIGHAEFHYNAIIDQLDLHTCRLLFTHVEVPIHDIRELRELRRVDEEGRDKVDLARELGVLVGIPIRLMVIQYSLIEPGVIDPDLIHLATR